MVNRQSAADAFTGFLTSGPSTEITRTRGSGSLRPVVVGARARPVLAALADGKRHGVEALRKATGLSFLEFAQGVRELRDAGLVEVGDHAGREVIQLTDAGTAQLGE